MTEGPHTDFRNIQISTIDLEIGYIRVFQSQKQEFSYKKSILCIAEGLHVDFKDYFNFAR